ncbi:MAG TPA: AMP-binding protein, partial [Thermoanaerobaculia bacterium]|nr:AMP-binding protein [Thermoanaerobaculia bacterium]
MAGTTAHAPLWTDADLHQSVAERFEQQVARFPDRLAVRSRAHSFTYAELDRWVNRIANAVLALRGERLEPMALFLKEGAHAIAGILAAYKAGKISLHLDATLPPERLRFFLEDSGAGLLVSAGADLPRARALAAEAGIPLLDLDGESVASAADGPPGVRVAPEAPAYLIYTSGSTGRPKAVVNDHRNVLWGCFENTKRNRVTEEDRILLVASPGSGQGVGMLQAILNGAALFPFDVEAEGLSALKAWIRDERITVYHSVPAVFRSLMKTVAPGERFPSMRLVRMGGDTVRREDAELFQRHFDPPCRLRIGYACTEAGTITFHFVDPTTPLGEGLVPVGRPCDEVSVRLVGDDGVEVPPGEAGEIEVTSRHLALGYWRREDLTRERFRPDPAGGPERSYRTGDLGRIRPDGLLEHLGRVDFQVKIRGFRVETGEVEAALRRLPGVEDAVVAASGSATGENRLVGYLVWSAPPLPHRTVRAELLKRLPDYMVPSAFVTLPGLPLTPRGKVDLKALPAPGPDAAAGLDGGFTGPRDDVERELAALWERLLGLRSVDVRSDFFEIGGDSLLAVELFAEIEKRMHRHLPVSVFAEASTVESLARLIREEAPRRWPSLVPIQPRGTRPPFFCVHTATGEVISYRNLARRLGGDQPFYGLRAERLPDLSPRYRRMEEMAARYVEEIRSVQPRGPYHLGGLSGGAMVAFEMARQLREAGEEVRALVLLDPPGRGGFDGERGEAPPAGLVGRLQLGAQWLH